MDPNAQRAPMNPDEATTEKKPPPGAGDPGAHRAPIESAEPAPHGEDVVNACARAFGVHEEDAQDALAKLRQQGFDVYSTAAAANG